ncbi:MAG TPA: ABC transporter permease [Terriglobales bacterium]|nr:ABC transporter permease [Terriglobales bacterium]
MTTQSNALQESAIESQRTAPAVVSATRPLYWSVRRELWENRSIYLAPLGVASAFLVGFLISLIQLPAKMRGLSALDPAHQREAIARPYDIAAGLMMLTGIIVSVFYCLDALHGERRDRSILFWKSLPVSDRTTVLAKASIPLVVVPLLTSAVAVGMYWIMLLLSSAVVLGSGQSVATLWTQVSFLQMSLLLLYHIFTAHTLWPAPIYGWLLLVSGWARRATFLWAALPLIAIAGVEGIAFHSSHFAALVGSRLIGAEPPTGYTPTNVFPTDPMTHIMPAHFLSSPGLWIGLAVTAAFLAAGVRLRRYQGPI